LRSCVFDVVVVGGGPAGSATALALLRQGARVAVVERREAAEDRLGESLHGAAAEALRELGVWEDFSLLEQRPSYLHRAAWGGSFEERCALRQRYGPDLHVDRARFDQLLLTIAGSRGAALLRPASVRRVERSAPGFRVTVAGGGNFHELVARRLIDATGRNATLARRLGATRSAVDRLVAVARSYRRGAREPTTLIEATDVGWWYSAPQPGGRLVAACFTDADLPTRHAYRDAVWSQCLEGAPLTRERLAGAAVLSPARSYLAAPALLAWDARLPLLPVGDAALCFDPIAAVGLCFALRSGIEAARAVLSGSRAAAAYRARIQRVFAEHLARRELIYGRERAVRKTPFWLSTRGGAVLGSL
jgi:flavin-dependent dehydrogenase